MKRKSKYKIVVDTDLCIGAASCVATAARTFNLSKDSKVVVRGLPWSSDERILIAAKTCPTKAIKIIDRKTGKQIWPK